MQNLVKTLKSDNVTINGIGFESHFIVGELPGNIQSNMEAFTALGVEVAVTELDIRMTLPETAALLAQQKKDYQTVVSACNAVENCVGITVWDWTDKVCFPLHPIRHLYPHTISLCTPGFHPPSADRELRARGTM